MSFIAFAHAADDRPSDLFQAMFGLGKAEQLDQLKKAIKAGVDVNAPTNFDRMLREGEKPSALKATGWPLDAAVQQARVEAVDLLLASGAKLHGMELALANLRGTPEESFAMTKALLMFGADVNSRDDGETGLYWASYQGKKASAELLLAQPKIKVDNVTTGGSTALMAAARQGHVELVLMLLKAGADPKIANKEGETAMSIAEKCKKPEKREALLASLKAGIK